MTGRTHDLAAVTALGGLLIVYPVGNVTLATAIVAFFANQIGGITPDIDQPTAPFWRNLPIGGYFGKVIGKMMGGHRFITHSLLGLALFGFLSRALLLFIHPLMPRVDIVLVWWAFMIGMLSHLLMDTLTKEGVPWLLPIPIKFGFPPIRKLRITTGKSMEKLLFLGLVGLDGFYLSTHYQHLLVVFRQVVARGYLNCR
jgi:inner membrane protein